ncbi:MAG: hypothetical protein PWR06_687 [Thermoanaerobacteraceae bacterium]|nr:hypothetical protein [Thermoanaerobacteraceae bacterium]
MNITKNCYSYIKLNLYSLDLSRKYCFFRHWFHLPCYKYTTFYISIECDKITRERVLLGKRLLSDEPTLYKIILKTNFDRIFNCKEREGKKVAKDLTGMIISIVFVFAVILVSEILRKVYKLGNEFTRKFVHIGVSHWWIAAMFLISDMRYAVIPPVLFVLLNYYSYKKNLFKSMERQENSDLGTVYFPISLIILILLTWKGGLLGGDYRYLGALGTLVMGYGDGFAAIIGKNFGKQKYNIFKSCKSLEGSVTMLVFSTLVSAVLLSIFRGFDIYNLRTSIIIAVVATLAEAFTPFGADNITVPAITTLTAYYMTVLQSRAMFLFIYMACIGFLLSFLIALAAYRRKSLTLDGSVGATFLGTVIYATSGLFGSALMILFFISSSLLSHFKKSLKAKVVRQFEKTGHRDIFQVFANGGIGLIYSVLFYITKNPSFLLLLGISFAAANADTWATELGILNRSNPVSLRTLKRVEKGTSGAVSLLGTTAALLGAGFIGIFTALGFKLVDIRSLGFTYIQSFAMVTLGGFAGSSIDSILGATVQGVYYSDELEGETEKRIYNGKPTLLVRGFRLINNDIVNFLSIALSSALFARMI